MPGAKCHFSIASIASWSNPWSSDLVYPYFMGPSLRVNNEGQDHRPFDFGTAGVICVVRFDLGNHFWGRLQLRNLIDARALTRGQQEQQAGRRQHKRQPHSKTGAGSRA